MSEHYEKWKQSIYDRAYKYIDEKHPEYVRKDGGVLSLESIIDILLEDLGRWENDKIYKKSNNSWKRKYRCV